MRPTGSVFTLSALAITLGAVLGGCESSTYVMSQLDGIPMPKPALLKAVSMPDCAADSTKLDVRPGKGVAGQADGKDFEQLNAVSTKRVETNTDANKSAKSKDRGESLKADLECYRNAADRVHRQLKKLQASTAATVDAVNEMKIGYQNAAIVHSYRGNAFMMRTPEYP